MPGIYVNDGGEMGSALSSALAQIANNYSPKTQAEAALLRLQTEGQNWTNRGLSDKTLSTEAGITAAGQLPGSVGAEIPSPLGAAVAGMAQPPADGQAGPNLDPTARGVISLPSGIMGRLMAGRFAQGGDFNDIRSGVELGQQRNMGPGNTYAVQGDVSKAGQIARQAPYTLEAGQERHVPGGAAGGAPAPSGGPSGGAPVGPAAGPAGETVTKGPSLYDKQVQQGQADADVKQFNEMSQAGLTATAELQKANDLQTLFNSVVGNAGAGSQIGSAAMQAILDRTGISLGTDKGAAIAEINKRIAEMVGGLRGPFGVQRMAGPEISALQRSLPNALMDARTFNDVMATIKGGLVQQQRMSEIARRVQNGQMSASDARNQLDLIAQDDPTAKLRQGHPTLFQTVGGSGGPADEKLPTVSTPEEARKLPPNTRFRMPDGRVGTTPPAKGGG